MRSLAIAGALLALATGATACGNQRVASPDLSALGKAGKTKLYVSPGDSLRVRYPDSWTLFGGASPALATIASGSAADTIYAYPRKDLRTDPASVRDSRRRIIASLEARAPGFLRLGSRITTIDGSPAVEVLGRGEINGHVVKTRSVHVFKPGVEWVIDAYATPGKFAAADRIAFGPILASVKLADRLPDTKAAGKGGDA